MSAALISYQSATAQTLYSAVNAETQMINGPYQNILNTGNYLAPCSQCPNDYMHDMTWDGDDPSVSFSDGNTTIVAALPSNINDPDIVVGLDGRVAMVVYITSAGVLEYKLYVVALPLTWSTTPSISSATTIATSARNPNIDLNIEDNVAVVWQMPNSTGTNADIEYNVGDLSSSGVNWNTSGPFQADNKTNTSYPLQSGDCLTPDIAISGGIPYGVHVTFLELNSGVYDWWKMDRVISGLPVWHSSFFTSSTSSKLWPPRICATRGQYYQDGFIAVLSDVDTTSNSEHVLAVNESNGSSSIYANSTMFTTGRFLKPVVAWVDDIYVNVAWQMEDNTNTTAFDIAVKRLDHNGQPHDNTWAIANQFVTNNQRIPSIAGAGISLPNNNLGQFAYLWVDDDDEVWYKVVPASDIQLKYLHVKITNSFSLFPNPASQLVTIRTEGELHSAYCLTDIFGHRIMEGQILNEFEYLSIAELPSGIYFINVDSDKKSVTKKFIKQ